MREAVQTPPTSDTSGIEPDFTYEKWAAEIGALLDEPVREPGEIDSRQYAKQAGISRPAAQYRLQRGEVKGLLTSRMVKEAGKWVRVYRKTQ